MPDPVTITINGRFFRDGDRILDQMRREVQREVAELGLSRLHQTLRPRPGGVYLSVSQAKKGQASTGNYRRHVNAFIRGAFHVITDGGVVYGPWLETGSGGTRFRGYGAFRRVAQWMRAQSTRVSGRIVNRHVRQLNGG